MSRLNTIARLVVSIVMLVVMPALSTYGFYLLLAWLNAPLIAMIITLAGACVLFMLFWFMILGLAIEDL